MGSEAEEPLFSDIDMEKCRDALLKMYDHAENRRGLQISRIWESTKFFVTIFSALLAATMAFLELTETVPRNIIFFLPLSMMGLIIVAMFFVTRQYNRFLEIITWISKIEYLLGLRKKLLTNMRYYDDEEYIVPDRYQNKGEFNSGKELKNNARARIITCYGLG